MEAPFLLLALLFSCVGGGLPASASISPDVFIAGEETGGINFTCVTRLSNFLTFLVNGTNPTTTTRQTRGIQITVLNTTFASLIIESTRRNNNTEIRCVSFMPDDSTATPSSVSRLLIQGTLYAPPLQITALSSPANSLRLSWSAPFTLDISNQEPDITYEVCYAFVTGSESPVCSMSEDTSYDFVRLSLPLEFMVTPINVAGEGNTSIITHSACNQGSGKF